MAITARLWVPGELNTAAKMNTIREDLLEIESLMQQFRTYFKQAVSYSTHGSNADYTLATTLANHLKADVIRCYIEGGESFFASTASLASINAYLTSNTNLRVRGPSGAFGTLSIIVVIEERQNLAA
jgi:hypothetical protein